MPMRLAGVRSVDFEEEGSVRMLQSTLSLPGRAGSPPPVEGQAARLVQTRRGWKRLPLRVYRTSRSIRAEAASKDAAARRERTMGEGALPPVRTTFTGRRLPLRENVSPTKRRERQANRDAPKKLEGTPPPSPLSQQAETAESAGGKRAAASVGSPPAPPPSSPRSSPIEAEPNISAVIAAAGAEAWRRSETPANEPKSPTEEARALRRGDVVSVAVDAQSAGAREEGSVRTCWRPRRGAEDAEEQVLVRFDCGAEWFQRCEVQFVRRPDGGGEQSLFDKIRGGEFRRTCLPKSDVGQRPHLISDLISGRARDKKKAEDDAQPKEMSEETRHMFSCIAHQVRLPPPACF